MAVGDCAYGKGFESVACGEYGKKSLEERQRIEELSRRADSDPRAMLELSDLAYKRQIRESSIPEC